MNLRQPARLALLLLLVLILTASCRFPAAHAAGSDPADAADLDGLFALVGSALVETGDGDVAEAQADIHRFAGQWPRVASAGTTDADDVAEALAAAERVLGAQQADARQAYQAVSRLSQALSAYEEARRSPADAGDAGRQAAQALLPLIGQVKAAVDAGNWAQARLSYTGLTAAWSRQESAIRTADTVLYGQIELHLGLLRIAVQAEPPKSDAAHSEAEAILGGLNGYLQDGAPEAASSSPAASIPDLLQLLHRVDAAIGSKNQAEALAAMNAFLTAWPNAEGAVKIRSATAYDRTEREMTEAYAFLQANPPQWDQASATLDDMTSLLSPLTGEAHYTAWDAALILLREGLEALLVLAALLSFLNRTGNRDKQGWIWSGVALGLVASGALAVILTYALNRTATGGAREWLEGATGLVSMVLMLTVGAWLHGKSHVASWNRYIHERMGAALASGSLWALFGLAFLAIFREGAETAIFYFGMALSIAPVQMMIGVVAALAVLIALGYAVIRFSVRLPVRPFFLCASLLIYYLVFKIAGESLHSLQVAGVLSAHPLPAWRWLSSFGLYATRETASVQLVLILLILLRIAQVELRRRRASPPVIDAAAGTKP